MGDVIQTAVKHVAGGIGFVSEGVAAYKNRKRSQDQSTTPADESHEKENTMRTRKRISRPKIARIRSSSLIPSCESILNRQIQQLPTEDCHVQS